MRIITKEIQITIDGTSQGFRLTKPDAFSGVVLLRLVLRLENREQGAFRMPPPVAGEGGETLTCPARSANAEPQDCPRRSRRSAESALTVLDLISSLSEEELRSVMQTCLNHIEVLLPAGPHPVMSGSEWGYPELKNDTVVCLKLVLEEITWALEGFFGGGGPDSPPADATTSQLSARTSTNSSSSR